MTPVDWGLLVLRVGLGVTFLPHGWNKITPRGPMRGPAGFAGWLRQLGVPAPLFFAWVVALMESVGAVLLILGLLTRLIALGLAINMLVAITLVKRGMAKKRFMEADGTGWELEFALLVAALALVLAGAGRIALDPMVGL
ncbi:MAG: DoxX family protein [Armatimonadota bacterium]|nr:DoxX family protein [Armatimonadota bacterium]MDR7490822.1 DoxX family protein [Armatimonadota bacterium]